MVIEDKFYQPHLTMPSILYSIVQPIMTMVNLPRCNVPKNIVWWWVLRPVDFFIVFIPKIFWP